MNLSDYLKTGLEHQQSGRFNEAISVYESILEKRSDLPDIRKLNAHAHYNLANHHQKNHHFETSIFHYKRAIDCLPHFAQAHHNLAGVYKLCGQNPEAINGYKQAISIDKNYTSAYLNLGHLYLEIEQYELAKTNYTTCHHINLKDSRPLFYLGILSEKTGHIDLASQYFQQAFQLEPNPLYRLKQALICPIIYEHTKDIHSLRQKSLTRLTSLYHQEFRLANPLQVGTTHYYQAYQGYNDRELNQLIAKIYQKICPSLNYVQFNSQKKAKIHIGIISRFLNSHSVGLGFGSLIIALSRHDFHVTTFFFPQKEDNLSQTLRNASDNLVELPLHLEGAQKKVAREGIDILIYLDIGMDPITYFLAFSRLAPLQLVMGGHPVTTGISTIDYYISYQTVEPPEAQNHYSEKLLLLNHLLGFYPVPDSTKKLTDIELPEGNCYLCPQSLYKIHPDMDRVFEGILRADLNATIILIQGRQKFWQLKLQQRFKLTMPEVVERIHFLPFLPFEQFLTLLKSCDVGLDTFPFGGGTTSYMMLHCGLPVVTYPGQFNRGRVTYAYYKSMNIFECVANSEKEYVDKAVNLANNKEANFDLSKRIQTQLSKLTNDAAIHELEDLLKEIYHEFHFQKSS